MSSWAFGHSCKGTTERFKSLTRCYRTSSGTARMTSAVLKGFRKTSQKESRPTATEVPLPLGLEEAQQVAGIADASKKCRAAHPCCPCCTRHVLLAKRGPASELADHANANVASISSVAECKGRERQRCDSQQSQHVSQPCL